jgi:tetratricopeptide (TPR) repeat protein
MGYRGTQPGGAGMIPGGPLGKARYALGMGRPDEAERIVRKRLEKQPDDVAARVLLAQILMQMQQTAEAGREARIALRYQPKSVDALMVLSSALTQQGGIRGIPAEAEQSARRAVELAPNNANAHVQLAEVLLRKREFDAARAEVDKAAKLEPRSPGVQLMRALVLLSDKDPEGAVQAADNAIRFGKQLAPGSLAQADFIKANALIQLNRYDEALSSLDTAERQNPMLAGANANTLRGRIYFKQRKYKQSYSQFLAAQLLSGRLVRLAPVLAGVNMVLVGLFGERAPFVLIGLLTVIVVLILFGLSYIPVVGPWIVMALVVALVGVFAVAFLRQLRGQVLPEEQMAKLSTIAAALFGGVVGVVGTLVIESWIGAALLHWRHAQYTPITIGIAGVVGIVLAAAASVAWQGLLGRYGGRGAQAAG